MIWRPQNIAYTLGYLFCQRTYIFVFRQVNSYNFSDLEEECLEMSRWHPTMLKVLDIWQRWIYGHGVENEDSEKVVSTYRISQAFSLCETDPNNRFLYQSQPTRKTAQRSKNERCPHRLRPHANSRSSKTVSFLT